MQRLKVAASAARMLTASLAAGSLGLIGPSIAQAQTPQYQSVRSVRGSITGVVSDDRGGPISGALVSALGTSMSSKATTDASGWFVIDALPVGEYTVQAHRSGFAGSARATVRVSGFTPASQRLQLRRLEGPVATTGSTQPVAARPIMAAGIALPGATLSDQPDADKTDGTVARDDHSHTETAWRLRHIQRKPLI